MQHALRPALCASQLTGSIHTALWHTCTHAACPGRCAVMKLQASVDFASLSDPQGPGAAPEASFGIPMTGVNPLNLMAAGKHAESAWPPENRIGAVH